MLRRSRIAVLMILASCASAHREPSAVVDRRTRDAEPSSGVQLSEELLEFSKLATEALNDGEADPPPSNTYSHQRLLGPRKRLGEPQVELPSAEGRPPLASTDCSGWLSFVLNTVSPLHEAVLQSQRRRGTYNRAYSDDFSLREGRRPWPRAFVVAHYLRSDHARETGFDPVTSFEDLRPGDIGAYAMGRYAKLSDDSRPKPRDTGHVFVVAGPPTVVDAGVDGYDGRGSLRKDVAKVIAVPVADASATAHFDPDSRKKDGVYTLPDPRPHSRAKAGGVGMGTIWFALSDDGRVLQRRLGPQQKYRPVLARAARLRGRISLDDTVVDGSDSLLVRVFENAPSEFAGISLGDEPVDLTGEGGLRLASGRVVLNGWSDFSGGVVVESADLIVTSRAGLGSGDIAVRGGSMTLEEPAIASSATLSVAEGVADGALRLDFRGRNVIQALRIGDETHRCGTWGGPKSGATFVHPVFSGRGVLQLPGDTLHPCNPR